MGVWEFLHHINSERLSLIKLSIQNTINIVIEDYFPKKTFLFLLCIAHERDQTLTFNHQSVYVVLIQYLHTTTQDDTK